MLRFDRLRFVALGIPSLLNAFLVPGSALANGPSPGQDGFPTYVILGVACLVIAVACIVKRGRDLGWSPATTLVGGAASIALMPACVVGLAALAFAGSHDRVHGYGPPPAPPTAEIWLGATVMATWPWAVLHLLRLVS